MILCLKGAFTPKVSETDSGPNTDTSVVKVDMLSMKSRNWGRLCIPYGIVLYNSVVYDRHWAPTPNPGTRGRQSPLWQDALPPRLLLPVAHVRSPVSDSLLHLVHSFLCSSEPPSTPLTYICSERSRGSSTDGSCSCNPPRLTQARPSTRSSTPSTTPFARSSARTSSGATSEFRASCSTVNSFPSFLPLIGRRGMKPNPCPTCRFQLCQNPHSGCPLAP